MAQPTVPLDFDPSVGDDDADYLQFDSTPEGEYVSWPLIAEGVFVPTHKFKWPDIKSIEKANSGKFKLHGNVGFSLGKYHEFVVEPVLSVHDGYHPAFFWAMMGAVEVTFGCATPFISYLLDQIREKHIGDWNELATVRILGASHEDGELAFLNSCRVFHQHTGVWPKLMALDIDWPEIPDLSGEPECEVTPPMYDNLEPMRFLYAAMVQNDDTAACVSLYRIIEYYSFFANITQMSKLRHDHSVSDADFSKKVLDLVSKDEKGPIFKAVQTISDAALLAKAVSDDLIPAALPHQLAEALYNFRNSIVHGKYSYGFTLDSGSVLNVNVASEKWRPLLFQIATRLMSHYGTSK